METMQRVLSADVSKLDFLYNRISMPRTCMAAWLHVPEFVEELISLDSEGVLITDTIVLEVCDKLMVDKFQDKRNREGFYFKALKQGINHVRRALNEEA